MLCICGKKCMIVFKNSILWLGLWFDFVVVGRFIVMRRPNFVRSLLDDPSLCQKKMAYRSKWSFHPQDDEWVWPAFSWT